MKDEESRTQPAPFCRFLLSSLPQTLEDEDVDAHAEDEPKADLMRGEMVGLNCNFSVVVEFQVWVWASHHRLSGVYFLRYCCPMEAIAHAPRPSVLASRVSNVFCCSICIGKKLCEFFWRPEKLSFLPTKVCT